MHIRRSTDESGACSPPRQNSNLDRWRLVSYAVEGGDNLTSPPLVSLELEDSSGAPRFATHAGPCQLDSLVRCAEEIVRRDIAVRSFETRTDWTKAGAWTDGLLTVEYGEAVIKTSGASTNPLKAFVQALMRALNRIQ